ncbi:MAG: N-acetylmuramoyl-L-alanine amidase [Litoreibacter sp.]
MPKCPFATWNPITGNVGPYTAGPFRIVHHTTEGSTAKGALSTYRTKRNDPHFTVDHEKIFQHIDTALSARSLRNNSGGVQTNKHSALQIEVVGFAHRPKSAGTLSNVARLCRWLELQHDVLTIWPNGPPKIATSDGRDPGGHNRDATVWATMGGHYGHSQVPENTHWDPAYTASELEFLMEAEFTDEGELRFAADMLHFDSFDRQAIDLSTDVSTMPDHGDYDEYDCY